MNVYVCISEEIETDPGGYGYEPPEYGRICEIAVARGRSQAKWLAFKTCRYFGDVRDMPKFSVKKIGTTDGQPRLLDDKEAAPWWRAVDGPGEEEATA